MTDQTTSAADGWQHIENIAADVDAELNPEIEAPEQGTATAAPESDPEMEMLLTEGIHITSAILAPNWKITKDEAGALGGVYAKLINKYFPDAGANFGVELTALLTTGAIIGSRIGTPRKLEEKPEKSEKDNPQVNEVTTLEPQPVGDLGGDDGNG